jgi:hypothetical protein
MKKGVIQTQGITSNVSSNPKILRSSVSKEKVKTIKPVKKIEIGAGALINQKVYRDTKEMDYWENEPAGMLYINYCDMNTLKSILDSGKISKKSDGFMDGLSVGS